MNRLSVAAAAILTGCGALAGSAQAIPAPWNNCTQFNHTYRHGVGKLLAHDKTSGDPVTNFKHSTRLYLRAMSYNRGLDRDKDGIACERQ